MIDLVKVAAITAGFVFSVLLIFLGLDTICLSTGATLCRVWRDFQWESIVAGALGLGGGIFVIASTRQQIKAVREDAANERLKDVDTLLLKCQENHEAIRDFLNKHGNAPTPASIDIFRATRVHWSKIRKHNIYDHDVGRVRDDGPLPESVRTHVSAIVKAMEHQMAIEFETEPTHHQTLVEVRKLDKDWSLAIKDMRRQRDAYASKLMRR